MSEKSAQLREIIHGCKLRPFETFSEWVARLDAITSQLEAEFAEQQSLIDMQSAQIATMSKANDEFVERFNKEVAEAYTQGQSDLLREQELEKKMGSTKEYWLITYEFVHIDKPALPMDLVQELIDYSPGEWKCLTMDWLDGKRYTLLNQTPVSKELYDKYRQFL